MARSPLDLMDIPRDSHTGVTRRSIARYLGYGSLFAAAAAIAPPVVDISAQDGLLEEDGIALADRAVGRFNAGDLDGLGALFAPDVAVHFPWPIPGSGANYLLGIYRLSKTLIPDSSIVIEELTIADDRIIAVVTIRGTQTGSLFGLPATGTPLTFAAIFIGRIADGKIVEIWGQADVLTVGLQIANAEDSVASLMGAFLAPPAAATPTPDGPSVDDLLAVPGVSFVLAFAADGSVVDYRSSIDIPQTEIEQAAKAGPTLSALLTLAATRYNDLSVLGWNPPKWVVYSGGDRWSAVLSGNFALFAETASTDFNALAAALGVTS